MMMLSILKFQFLHFAILLTCSKTFHYKIQLIIYMSEYDGNRYIFSIVSLFIYVIDLFLYQFISYVKYLIYEMKSMFIKYVSICQIFIRIICPMWKLYQTIHEDAMSQNQTSKEERRKGETLADIQHTKRI